MVCVNSVEDGHQKLDFASLPGGEVLHSSSFVVLSFILEKITSSMCFKFRLLCSGFTPSLVKEEFHGGDC